MKQTQHPSLKPLALATFLVMGMSVAHANSQWAGNYYGLGIGSTQTRTSSSTSYGNSGTSPATGWTNDQFRGSVYNSVNTMQAIDDESDFFPSTVDTNGAMPNLNSWSTTDKQNDSKATGVAMIGFMRQTGNVVWGGELRSTFGNFGAEQNSSLSMSGTKTGGFSDSEGASFTFTNYDGAITSPSSSPVTNWNIGYNANYSQTSTQAQQVKLSMINAAVARVGYSLGNTMIYALGGLAQSSVKASSRATVTETVSGTVHTFSGSSYSTPSSTISAIAGTKTYNLSGEQSKNAVGFAIGAGAEWLISKGLSVRAEGTYYDLGNVSVTASTTDGAISYTTRQDVKAFSTFVALIKKF